MNKPVYEELKNFGIYSMTVLIVSLIFIWIGFLTNAVLFITFVLLLTSIFPLLFGLYKYSRIRLYSNGILVVGEEKIKLDKDSEIYLPKQTGFDDHSKIVGGAYYPALGAKVVKIKQADKHFAIATFNHRQLVYSVNEVIDKLYDKSR